MKLRGDPWNNRWSSFYGIAWNVSMEFHRKCHNPPWKMSMQKFPWNSMEIGALMFSMEFHGKCPNPPCKYFPWKSMEKFPWNSMEIDVLILHGEFSTKIHGIPWNSMEVFHTGLTPRRIPIGFILSFSLWNLQYFNIILGKGTKRRGEKRSDLRGGRN